MIRRDYILREIEEFVAMLTKITGLARDGRQEEAADLSEETFHKLTGAHASEVVEMSETELLARLIQDGPAQMVETRAFMLATLLKTNGDRIASQGRLEESRQYYLKGLHLLLDVFGRVEITERPDFVPAVEAFLTGLRDEPLPFATNALLMQHYERTGELARAEDALFGLLDAEPGRGDVLDFGRLFYQRLLELDDRVLAEGNLPREEVLGGLAELAARQSRLREATGG